MIYKGLVIADIHAGVTPVNQFTAEIFQLIHRIDNTEDKLDYLVIAGDYFDRQMYISDCKGYTALQILTRIIISCKNNKIKLRIVYGTESHEVNQYEALKSFEDGIYYRVIRHVEEEELFKDFHVLYLPEELLSDFTCYDPFFSKHKYYDYVFGHGIIHESMKMASLASSKQSLPTNEKIYHVEELSYICKGMVIFGHYHIFNKINNVYYVGSYSRFKFGEEDDKGWMETSYDEEEDSYDMTFIVNTLAPKYDTVVLDASDTEILSKELSTLLTNMKENHHHYKIKIGVGTDVEENAMIYDTIHEYKNHYQDIQFDVTLEDKSKITKEEVESSIEDEFPILFDPNIKEEEKLSYFTKHVFHNEVPVEFITKIADKTLE